MKYLSVGLITLVLIFSGCSDDSIESPKVSDRISIINGGKSDRVKIVESGEVNLKPYNSETGFVSKSTTLKYNFKLVKVAEVDPPQLDGATLQATHVEVDGDMAYVSYNTKGNEYAGGVDVFDVSQISNPTIVSQMLLRNTDVNALDYNNGRLYLAEAVKNDTLTSPAVLEVYDFVNGQLSADNSEMVDLSSYSATSVVKSNDHIYVTTGDKGAMHVFYEDNNLTQLHKIELPDLRSVALFADKKVVLQGNPAKVQIFSPGNAPEDSYDLPSVITPESKTDIDIRGTYAYVPANAEGLKVMNLTDGSIIKEFPKPQTPTGMEDSDYVTNSVALFDEVLLIANGGAGLYCGQVGADNIPEIKAIADLGASANFVDAKKNSNGNIVIFVATGKGGLKIFEYQKTLEVPGDTSFNYLSQYDDKGSPLNKENITPASNVLDNYKKVLSTAWLDYYKPELFDSISKHITTNKLTKVWVTFLSEGGDFDNSLGFYSFDVNKAPQTAAEITKKTIIFPNTNKTSQGGGLQPGDRVYLGEFPANTGIGFFLYTDAWNSTTNKIDMNKRRWTLYTNYSFNPGNYVQHFFIFDSQHNRFFLTYEDLYYDWDVYKDHDYDDVIFMVETDNDGLNKDVFIDMAQYIK